MFSLRIIYLGSEKRVELFNKSYFKIFVAVSFAVFATEKFLYGF